MRYSKGRRTETYERIVKNASLRIRERGIESMRVADLMKTAGLTHGGFYLHFKSRKDLINQAFARAMGESIERWQRLVDKADGEGGFADMVSTYLTKRHCADIARGCALPALSADVRRGGAAVRKTFSEGVDEIIELLAKGAQRPTEEARRDAIATLSVMLGALMLARATDRDALTEEILEAGRHAALEMSPRNSGDPEAGHSESKVPKKLDENPPKSTS
jgi:TetR/AcrR family transcriptional regulator, transcriptional repressor for nem operon